MYKIFFFGKWKCAEKKRKQSYLWMKVFYGLPLEISKVRKSDFLYKIFLFNKNMEMKNQTFHDVNVYKNTIEENEKFQ